MGMAIGGPIKKEDDTSVKSPSARDIAQAELGYLVGVSKEYDRKIKTAKTNAKRNFYMKKLIKNNKLVMEMLVAVDKLPQRTDTDGESD